MMTTSALLQILDLARWAPSGDNTQPWRFEVVDEHHFVIHGRDTRDHCVYDLDGHASQLSLGALIETAAIAATQHGLRLTATRRVDSPVARPVIDVVLAPEPALQPSPLVEAIPLRSVQRRPMSTTALTDAQRQAIYAALPPGYRLLWLDTPTQRRHAAALMYRSANIRLTTPEAYAVHRQIIHWGARFSEDRVPSQALGVGAATVSVMRFGMHSWQRVQFLNRYAGGTLLPRIQMDWWPGLRCAAHVAILSDRQVHDIDDYIAGGRAVQRFWLAVTRQQLQHQPEITPLVFARYARQTRQFSIEPDASRQAIEVAHALDQLLDGQSQQAVWLGRVGRAPRAQARSGRLSLQRLLQPWGAPADYTSEQPAATGAPECKNR